jgi:hypothetical protein
MGRAGVKGLTNNEAEKLLAAEGLSGSIYQKLERLVALELVVKQALLKFQKR